MDNLQKFYFRFPRFVSGWTEVVAPDKKTACMVYQALHLPSPGSVFLDYGGAVCSEEEFAHLYVIPSKKRGSKKRGKKQEIIICESITISRERTWRVMQ